MKKLLNKKLNLAIAIAAALHGIPVAAIAQTNDNSGANDDLEIIEVSGIRNALASALAEKRSSANIKEVIQAEDIGKLPDNNLAEVLENITGVQITRSSGVGTGVQIRGTGDNRVEINGVSSVSSGAGRTGISFDDLPAALISSLEVTKVPEAKTVEGSVGGTINLRTLRGLSLKEQLVQFRVQGENSDLADSTVPKVSGTFGDNWQTDFGKIGIVLTGSYAEQDVASITPRFDRDRVVTPDSGRASAEPFAFLRTQFLAQPFLAYDYETKNFTGSIEFQPNDDLKFYFDATVNDQERAQKSSRAYFSGTGANPVIDNTTNTGFETIDLGSVDGQFGTLNLGEVTVVTSGIIGIGGTDPNLRVSNDTSSRLTQSRVFALGSEWSADKFKLSAEVSYSDSETDLPSLNSELDFINPNTTQPGPGTANDNGTPAIFNISGNTFEFGIAQGLAESPTTAQLLDPNNYALRSVGNNLNTREGSEAAARVDFIYDISETNPFFTDIKAGVRWNKSNSTTSNNLSSNNFGSYNRPRASLFESIITPGANNFNGADDRTLYIPDYLTIDNDIAFTNPQLVIDTINQAIMQNNANVGATDSLLATPTIQISSFFDIDEETTAVYVQSDYELEVKDIFISGNLGLRYVNTDLTSYGTSLGNADPVTGEASIIPSSVSTNYDFYLPRFNLVAEVTEDFFVRAGVAQDIRRPDFDSLSTSTTFSPSPSSVVRVGNPELTPEKIWSYDLSFEYYFTPSSLVSVGFFHKERKDLITRIQDQPDEPIGPTGQIERDVTAPCEGGGIFNPTVPWQNFNVFSSRTDVTGICVARQTQLNANGTETQSGIELAVQYDLAEFEDSLGWASGFGIIANYTYQKSGAGLTDFHIASDAINQILGRTDTNNSTATLDDDVVTERIVLDNLSQNAYNITLFYDKHDLNARVRYTWRDAYTQTENVMRFNVPPVIGARGQLNASIGYDINETVSVGIEGVNLTREDSTKWCFNEGTLLCEQDITDRRLTLGVTVKL
ncbi:MAG: TonB-dependent receptor [Paraglaciecola sp.]|uniref:TonB-dependent receptor n=1 Tax=Paraglaciecola sp. TaxID=1920173 RepID=UPI00273F0B83|nr:TonB-dependent receptor [Paraglaciecola sp.]MDP5030934.1 TonB-dependent receptor [Paraglaciecola sp.]MDP5130927.1 TonB-dependent receptor [Paraglaciecola sp.]